jgi:hypothetical protein
VLTPVLILPTFNLINYILPSFSDTITYLPQGGSMEVYLMRLILSVFTVLALLTLLAMTPLFAQEGESEYEPNNSDSNYQVLDEGQNLVNGYISLDNDRDDWFALPGSGINTTLTLTFNPDEVEIDWEVIDDGRDPDTWDDRDPQTVAHLTNYGSPETVTIQTFGHCEIHLWAYSGQGNYTITIGEQTCQGIDEIEPNDTNIMANLISGDEIQGYACPGDSDWYVIDGQQDRYWSITCGFDAGKVEVDWEIFSDDNRVANDTSYGSPDNISCEIPGTCYIHVWHFTGEGPYIIDLESYTNTDI